jgi:hypothetical protein
MTRAGGSCASALYGREDVVTRARGDGDASPGEQKKAVCERKTALNEQKKVLNTQEETLTHTRPVTGEKG